jgi:hypothetical protein
MGAYVPANLKLSRAALPAALFSWGNDMRIFRLLIAALFLAWAPVQAWAVEVDLQFLKGTQFLDSTGSPLDSGTINIYDAGTTDLRTTYSDAAGTVANTLNGSNQIVLDSEGRVSESVYIPTGSWKFVLKDSGTTTIVSEDTIEGALDTSTFTVTSAKAEMPWISKTSAYTATSDDMGKGIAANATGSSFTITLPSAATVGDGKTLAIKHTGTANVVTIATTSSQTIKHFNTARTTWNLTQPDQTVWLASDGAGWHVISQVDDLRQQVVKVEDDDLSAPPASPTAGAWYIVGASPTGDWSSYSQYDLVQASGDGGWINVTPSDGWIAWIEDEDKLALFHSSQWNTLRNDETVNALAYATFQQTQDKGTSGGSATTGAWTTYTLNTEVTNIITGASLSSNQFTLPAGTYKISGWVHSSANADISLRLYNITDSVTAIDGGQTDTIAGSNQSENIPFSGVVEIGGSKVFEVQYYADNAGTLGLPTDTRYPEVLGQVDIIDLKTLEGEQGDPGAQGNPGADGSDGGWEYTWETSNLTGSGIAAGEVMRNNGTLGSITQIFIHETDNDSNDLSSFIATWDDGDSATSSTIRITGSSTDFIYFDVTGLTDNGSDVTLTGSVAASSGTLSDEEVLRVFQIPVGDKGDDGSQGPAGSTGSDGGFVYAFSTDTTETDPTSGFLKFSSSTLANVTEIYIYETTTAASIAEEIATWDDGTDAISAKVKVSGSAANDFIIFELTPANVDNGDWVTLSGSVTSSSGTFSANEDVRVNVTLHGNVGPQGNKGNTGDTGADGDDGMEPGTKHLVDATDTNMTAPDDTSLKFDVDVTSTFSGLGNIAIDADDVYSADISDWVAAWDDAGQSGSKGTLTIRQIHTPSNFMIADVTSSVTDNTSWLQVPVVLRSSNGTFTDNTEISVQFAPAGSDGSDGAGSVSVAFQTFTPTSGTSVVADDATDTMTLTEGSCIGITGTGASDDITIGIPDNCITVGQIASGGVASAEVQDNTLSADDLAAGSVGTSEIADGTVSHSDMVNMTTERLIGRTTASSGSREEIDISSLTQETAPAAGDDLLGMESGGDMRRFDVGDVGTGQQTIWVPANAMTAETTNGCASSANATSSNSIEIPGFDCDDSTDEGVQLAVQMPKGWNAGTVVPQVVWFGDDVSGDKTVVWGVQGMCVANDEAADSAYGTAQTVSDANGSAAQDIMITDEFSAVTLSGAGAEEWCSYRVYRDANAAGDNFTGDATLLGLKIHYTTDENTDD